MKFSFFVLLFIGLTFVSCSDLKKGEQLNSIDAMHNTVDSIEIVLNENKIDTLSALITATTTLELRIKNNYYSDTIDMELGRKMDAFKRTRLRLGPLSNTFNTIKTGVEEEKVMLKNLRTDIDNGNGDRKKYQEYVSFEQKKVGQLRSLLNAYVLEKTETMELIDKSYPEMNAFSLSLLNKKKKKV
jgi:hypothetical protein